VVGGGNAELLAGLPRSVQRGDNSLAFKGGIRIWRKG